MKDLDAVRAAFAALPARVTLDDIAAATGRTRDTVRNHWTSKAGFPPGERDHDGVHRRDRDAVLAWYQEQPLADPAHPGGNKAADRAREVPALDVRLTTAQIAEVLGLTPNAVSSHYLGAHRPGTVEDPFPAADTQGLRPWPVVRAWLLRRDDNTRQDDRAQPLPRTATATWLAERLGVTADTAQAVLHATGGARLPRTALADALAPDGLTVQKINYYARTYGPDTADPFPPTDEHRTRDVAAVRAWLTRHTAKTPDQILTDLAHLDPHATADQICTAAGISAKTLRTWTKQPGFPPVIRDGNTRYRDRDTLITWYQQHHTTT